MARKTIPPEPQPARLTQDQMRAAIPKLRRRAEELGAFDPQSVNDRSDPKPKALEQKIDDTLVDVLGADTLDYRRFRVGSLDHASIRFGGTPLAEIREGFADGKADALSKLNTLIEIFEEKISDLESGQAPSTGRESEQKQAREPKSVFVVHGHDEAAREAVARILDRLGVRAVILHEQANQGHTLIEKLEHYGDVDFAVVLLTPDDEGREAGASGSLQPRARQNVVLELGFFIGKLSRKRVCALYRDVKIPSDYLGVIYVPLDDQGGWQLRLAKELRAAGFSIDMNKI